MSAKIELTITVDPHTKKVAVRGPLDHPALCLNLLQAGTQQLFQMVNSGQSAEEPRKVKTLDELGVMRARRAN